MVKRQTVWLSTMMVLSLMLIGYYTMNSGTTTTTSATGGSSIATSTQDAGNSTGTSGATHKSGGTTTSSGKSQASTTSKTTSNPTASQPTSGQDWFTNYQTKVDQQIAKEEGDAEQVIGNSNASTQQISQAQQDMRQYEALSGGIMQAREAVIGEGYKNCVIVPNSSGNGAQVWVQTKQLTASDAVKVMNIVSQQLNVPINSVIVHQHA